MKRKKRIPLPFAENVKTLEAAFGLSKLEALDRVQSTYSDFKSRNQKLIERQNDEANHLSVQLVSHFAILSTLMITFSGVFISQNSQQLTQIQRLVILVIFGLGSVSILTGAVYIIRAINFHNEWALAHRRIEDRANRVVASGEIQYASELNEIEAEEIMELRTDSGIKEIIVMTSATGAGLLLSTLLLYGYIFDVPFWN